MYGVRWLGLHTESHMRLNTLYATHYVLEMAAGAVRKSKSDVVLSTPAVSLYTE